MVERSVAGEVSPICTESRKLASHFFALHEREEVCPRTAEDHFGRYVFRELNTEADAKANLGRSSGACNWRQPGSVHTNSYLRLYFDGSYKDGSCGAGFVVFASESPGVQDDSWQMVAWMCFPVEADSITAAELEAAAAAHAFVSRYLDSPTLWSSFFNDYCPWSYAA